MEEVRGIKARKSHSVNRNLEELDALDDVVRVQSSGDVGTGSRRISERKRSTPRPYLDEEEKKSNIFRREDKDLVRENKNRDRSKSTSRSRNQGRKKANTEVTSDVKTSKIIGVVLAVILFMAMVGFVITLMELNMLPMKYMLVIILVLSITGAILLGRQVFSRKKSIVSKCICVLLTVALCTGTFYIHQTNKMMENITNVSGLKIDEMAVVVMNTSVAEDLEDAIDYSFGVQYTLNGDHVLEAVDHINEVLEKEIHTMEYSNIGEQSQALISGEVQALIYNVAYEGIIEEEYPEYASMVKVIYTYEIESEIEEQVMTGNNGEEAFAVYISGIDVYGSINKSSRSDVNILMYVNPVTKQILLINTPRDYYVTFPGITGNEKDKLTHAGIYGVNVSMDTLSALYDCYIDYYARVNFTSLIEIVDALGGLEVYSDQAFTTLHGNYNISVGMNSLNGEETLGFTRERFALENGDDDRGRNQQEVIKAMIKKAISPAIISGATKIMASVSGNVDTSMPQVEIQELIKNQLANGGDWNILSVSATGEEDRQYCYSYTGNSLYVTEPNYESVDMIKELIQRIEDGEVLTEEMVAQ